MCKERTAFISNILPNSFASTFDFTSPRLLSVQGRLLKGPMQPACLVDASSSVFLVSTILIVHKMADNLTKRSSIRLQHKVLKMFGYYLLFHLTSKSATKRRTTRYAR